MQRTAVQTLKSILDSLVDAVPNLKVIQVIQATNDSSAHYAQYRAVCERHRTSAVTMITTCFFEQHLLCAPAFNVELTVLSDGRIKLRGDPNDLKRLFVKTGVPFAYTVIENATPTMAAQSNAPFLDTLREAIQQREGSCQVVEIEGENPYRRYNDKIKELEKAGDRISVVRMKLSGTTFLRYPYMDIELRCLPDGRTKLTGNAENFAKLLHNNAVVVPKQQ